MTRQEANRELVKKISYLVENFPDQRFTQLLYNFMFLEVGENEYYLEPEDLLKRVDKSRRSHD